jgi:hypothetical protein
MILSDLISRYVYPVDTNMWWLHRQPSQESNKMQCILPFHSKIDRDMSLRSPMTFELYLWRSLVCNKDVWFIIDYSISVLVTTSSFIKDNSYESVVSYL